MTNLRLLRLAFGGRFSLPRFAIVPSRSHGGLDRSALSTRSVGVRWRASEWRGIAPDVARPHSTLMVAASSGSLRTCMLGSAGDTVFGG